MNFSEESIFFIQNWGIIEKLLSSEKNFKKEFSEFLYSIEEILMKKDWWNTKLVFEKYDQSQIYVSRENWHLDNEYSIWIGVEDFTPERLFGVGEPVDCYLWITGNQKEKIIADLSQMLKKEDYFKDYLVSSGGYVLKKYLRKYTEEEYKDFISGASLNEIVGFIEKVYLFIKDYEIQESGSSQATV